LARELGAAFGVGNSLLLPGVNAKAFGPTNSSNIGKTTRRNKFS